MLEFTASMCNFKGLEPLDRPDGAYRRIFRTLEEGEPVEFSVAQTDKGLQAENVVKVG